MGADLQPSKPLLDTESVELERQRCRMEVWLKAIHYLSVDLQAMTAEALLEGWAASMVDDVGFEVAAAYESDPSHHRMVQRSSGGRVRMRSALGRMGPSNKPLGRLPPQSPCWAPPVLARPLHPESGQATCGPG